MPDLELIRGVGKELPERVGAPASSTWLRGIRGIGRRSRAWSRIHQRLSSPVVGLKFVAPFTSLINPIWRVATGISFCGAGYFACRSRRLVADVAEGYVSRVISRCTEYKRQRPTDDCGTGFHRTEATFVAARWNFFRPTRTPPPASAALFASSSCFFFRFAFVALVLAMFYFVGVAYLLRSRPSLQTKQWRTQSFRSSVAHQFGLVLPK